MRSAHNGHASLTGRQRLGWPCMLCHCCGMRAAVASQLKNSQLKNSCTQGRLLRKHQFNRAAPSMRAKHVDHTLQPLPPERHPNPSAAGIAAPIYFKTLAAHSKPRSARLPSVLRAMLRKPKHIIHVRAGDAAGYPRSSARRQLPSNTAALHLF